MPSLSTYGSELSSLKDEFKAIVKKNADLLNSMDVADNWSTDTVSSARKLRSAFYNLASKVRGLGSFCNCLPDKQKGLADIKFETSIQQFAQKVLGVVSDIDHAIHRATM